jgi:hypothetical protein
MGSKKYNNKSEHLEHWTTQKLKKTATGAFCSIFQLDCFSTHDLLLYDACAAELEKRGYSISENKSLSITKA